MKIDTYCQRRKSSAGKLLSASDYGDFTRVMALYKLYYLLTYLVTYCKISPFTRMLPDANVMTIKWSNVKSSKTCHG